MHWVGKLKYVYKLLQKALSMLKHNRHRGGTDIDHWDILKLSSTWINEDLPIFEPCELSHEQKKLSPSPISDHAIHARHVERDTLRGTRLYILPAQSPSSYTIYLRCMSFLALQIHVTPCLALAMPAVKFWDSHFKNVDGKWRFDANSINIYISRYTQMCTQDSIMSELQVECYLLQLHTQQ